MRGNLMRGFGIRGKLKKAFRVLWNTLIPCPDRKIRYFNQYSLRYYFKKYGQDSLGNYGCGPFVCAIAASTLLQERKDPALAAQWAYEHGYYERRNGSLHSLIPAYCREMGLACADLGGSIELLQKRLQEKDTLGILLCRRETFARGRHFVVVSAKGENFQVYNSVNVLDCYQTFTKEQLKAALTFEDLEGGPIWCISKKEHLELSGSTVLITGAAGFIGSYLAKKLLTTAEDVQVVGLDNLNDYYEVSLKESRLQELTAFPGFSFVKGNVADKELVEEVFARYQPKIVVHLAAQAGVRYSITHPDAYIEANLMGFHRILEACRHSREGRVPVEHLIYASSSSVYGLNAETPYSTQDKTDSPVSLYAATKKSNELMAHAYSKLYGIPATGLRFFTVYGPKGRPDMAYFSFAEKMRKGEMISLFNYGNCQRDFTYIEDIVEGILRVMKGAPVSKEVPYALYNIGGQRPENLLTFVEVLKDELAAAGVLPEDYDLQAHVKLVPMQPGDVVKTCADTADLERDFGFTPGTPLRAGLHEFAQWYAKDYCERKFDQRDSE